MASVERHRLDDRSWGFLEPLFPRQAATGRPPTPTRLVLDAVLWILETGAPWRDLPAEYGPWQTAYGRFARWRDLGIFDAVLDKLRRLVRSAGRIDKRLYCVDTTVVRASRAAGGARRDSSDRQAQEPPDHALGRSRGGFGTKLHLACDGRGTPLAALAGPGQESDLKRTEPLLRSAVKATGRPTKLAGDKGYSAPWVRRLLKKLRIGDVVPTRIDQRRDFGFDRRAYRRRNVVERLVGWLKESRRVATRYEKLAVSYLAMVKFAMIRRLLRMLRN